MTKFLVIDPMCLMDETDWVRVLDTADDAVERWQPANLTEAASIMAEVASEGQAQVKQV